MLALSTVLVVVLISLIVTRVATVALTQTGLSRETARFQARSALSGAGFTTAESEKVVNHPVRRRIILTLMLLGSAGLVAAIASLAISFGGADFDQRFRRGFVLVAGLFVLWRLALSPWVDRQLPRAIGWFLRRRGFRERNRASLVELSGDYEVAEVGVEAGDRLASEPLGELGLREPGVTVLGVLRSDGEYVGEPTASTRFGPGDTLIVYGREGRIAAVDTRGPG